MKTVNSYEELMQYAGELENAWLFLYKSGADQSDCALRNLQEVLRKNDDLPVCLADVNRVRDIHPVYRVDSVPVLIELEKGESRNVVKGCHQEGFFSAFFENALYRAQARKEGKTPKRVTVYTTPSCPWCNTVKAYLRKNGIPFREVDVSRNEQAAQELVRRSGQQGVPQTDINGQIVVGFDRKKLDRLLELE